MAIWFRTDEAEEAVSAVEAVARFARDVDSDVSAWRWTVIALHTAVQGFLVLALRDGSGTLVLPEKLAGKWLAAHQRGGPYPKERLDSFPNLYAKFKSTSVAASLGASPFSPTAAQERSIKRLHELRNQFIHFLPASWSLEVSGLPHICLNALEVLRYAARHYRHLVWHDTDHSERLDRASDDLAATLRSLQTRYESLGDRV